MKKVLWVVGFVFLSAVLGVFSLVIGSADEVMSERILPTDVKAETNNPVIVIDPGHGGEDGGCVGEDGTLEKNINLAVSENVCEMLNAAGVYAVMTRTEDKMLYDMYSDLKDYTHNKKLYDLKNRVRFAKDTGAKAFVSIHMNKFPQKQYKGLQVYYSTNNDGSTALADSIQKSVATNLQKDNARLIKPAGSSIYVLHRAYITSVLCECGFLSNAEDLENLKNEEYRKKLSLCVACGIIEWMNS